MACPTALAAEPRWLDARVRINSDAGSATVVAPLSVQAPEPGDVSVPRAIGFFMPQSSDLGPPQILLNRDASLGKKPRRPGQMREKDEEKPSPLVRPSSRPFKM